jgi:osmoprotectant transport system permease protein
MPRNRVLFILVLVGLAAALGLAFLGAAPNRLVSGRPIAMVATLQGARWLIAVPGLVLATAAFPTPRPAVCTAAALAAAALLVALPWLAGAQAAFLAEQASSAARTSLGGAFWTIEICAALALRDALDRLGLRAPGKLVALVVVLGALSWLALSGRLDALAITREFLTREDAFGAAARRHVLLVGAALLPTLLLGFPLGILAHRRPRLAPGIFTTLNLIQTIPAIALFGLLIAPLSGLVALFPALARLGVAGIGVTPALIALTFYSLLPLARNTAEGLASVPGAVTEAASGLGMRPRQIFWRVEFPLALPVFLAGLRIATVQAVGLAAVAALIGAGGFGAIMFQGLFADALDLVLLGALPVIALGIVADAFFRLAAARFAKSPA